MKKIICVLLLCASTNALASTISEFECLPNEDSFMKFFYIYRISENNSRGRFFESDVPTFPLPRTQELTEIPGGRSETVYLISVNSKAIKISVPYNYAEKTNFNAFITIDNESESFSCELLDDVIGPRS